MCLQKPLGNIRSIFYKLHINRSYQSESIRRLLVFTYDQNHLKLHGASHFNKPERQADGRQRRGYQRQLGKPVKHE